VSLQTIDPDLVRRITGGEYEIDPQAVAEAMLRRRARLDQLRQLSRMLVTGQRNGSAAGREQP
jgi:hypothetical protein